MKRFNSISILILSLLFFNNISSQEDVKNKVDYDITLTSNYIWRDFLFDYEALQTNITFNYKDTGLYFNAWNSVGNTGGNDLQTTLTLGYTKSYKNIEFGTALILYHPTFPGSREILISTTFPIKKINTSVNLYAADNEAIYFTIGIPGQKLFTLKKYPIIFNTSLAYRTNDIAINNGFRDLNVGISMPIETKHYTFSIYSTYTNVLAQDRTRLQVGANVYFK